MLVFFNSQCSNFLWSSFADLWALLTFGHCWLVGITDLWALLTCRHCWLVGIADLWALLIYGYCWFMGIADLWALLTCGHCWLLDIADCWILLIVGHCWLEYILEISKWSFLHFCKRIGCLVLVPYFYTPIGIRWVTCSIPHRRYTVVLVNPEQRSEFILYEICLGRPRIYQCTHTVLSCRLLKPRTHGSAL